MRLMRGHIEIFLLGEEYTECGIFLKYFTILITDDYVTLLLSPA